MIIFLVFGLILGALVIIGWLLYLQNAYNKRREISRLKNYNEKLAEELDVKKVEVEEEKSKLAATNAYLDGIEEDSKNL